MLKFLEAHKEHLPKITLFFMVLTAFLLLRRSKRFFCIVNESFNGNSASANLQESAKAD